MRRGRPPRRVSAKRFAERPSRQAVVEQVFARDRTCQAAGKVPGVACRGPLDPHEIIPRSAWGQGYLVAENVIVVCRAHHDWIDDNPKLAHEVGLHGYSWERDPTKYEPR